MDQFKGSFLPTGKLGGAFDFLRRFAAVRLQKNDWYEPCKSRDLRTVL